MKISSIQLYRYRLSFQKPMVFRKKLLTAREGLVIKVLNEDGVRGYGEAAPLPGFSEERWEDVVEEAMRAARSLTGCTFPEVTPPLSDRFERWLYAQNLSPSLNCGLQTAFLDLHARSLEKPLARYLNPTSPQEVFVNGLIEGNLVEAVEQATELSRRRMTSVKLKVGKARLEEDIQMVREVRRILGDAVGLRLDANRAWDYEEGRRFGKAVADCKIDYIEEPLKDPTRLVAYAAETGLPCALDETVRERGWEYLERWRGIRSVILKPTLLGGFEITLWLARRAWNVGILPVITSTFESGVGLYGLAHLAAALNQPDVPVGLDTASMFTQDVLHLPLVKDRGIIRVDEVNGLEDLINWSLLQEISL